MIAPPAAQPATAATLDQEHQPGTVPRRPGAGRHPSGPAGRRPGPPASPESPASPASPADRRSAAPPGPAGRPGAPSRPDAARPRSTWLEELVAGFAQLYLEVECGRRPPRMARRLLDPRLAAQLEGRWVRRGGVPGQVVQVAGARTSSDVVDAVAVVRRGDRTGAIAIRLARRHGRWLVTEAARPEDGPLPALPFTFPTDEADPLEELLDAAAARPPEAPAPAAPLEVVA